MPNTPKPYGMGNDIESDSVVQIRLLAQKFEDFTRTQADRHKENKDTLATIVTKQDRTNGRVTTLEKFMWMALGMGTIVGVQMPVLMWIFGKH